MNTKLILRLFYLFIKFVSTSANSSVPILPQAFCSLFVVVPVSTFHPPQPVEADAHRSEPDFSGVFFLKRQIFLSTVP